MPSANFIAVCWLQGRIDLVPRHCLWKVLKQRELAGRVLASVQTMYAQDRSCVVTSEGATEMFECSIGMKQGCPASPLLFSLYLDELEALLWDAADQTDCPRLAQLLIAILLFADDIVLFSSSEKGLQQQLNILQKFCTLRGLEVNAQKTKTMVLNPPNLTPHRSRVLGPTLSRLIFSSIWASPCMAHAVSQQP